jgi:hypothetical protein
MTTDSIYVLEVKRNSSRNRFKDIRSIMVAGTLGLLGHARPLTQE